MSFDMIFLSIKSRKHINQDLISCFSGISYLHNEAPVKVIHRDLKSKNGKILIVLTKNCFHIINVVFQKKIHTHPMKGHQKFLGGGC